MMLRLATGERMASGSSYWRRGSSLQAPEVSVAIGSLLARWSPIERPGLLKAVEADQPDVGVRLRPVVPFALAGAHPLAGVAPALIVVLGVARRMEADPRPRAQTLQHVPADERCRPRAMGATGYQVAAIGHPVPPHPRAIGADSHDRMDQTRKSLSDQRLSIR